MKKPTPKKQVPKKRVPKGLPQGRGFAALCCAIEDHPLGELIYEYRQWRLAREQADSPGTPADLAATYRKQLHEMEAELGRKLLRIGPREHARIAKRAAYPSPTGTTFRSKVRFALLMAKDDLAHRGIFWPNKKELADATRWQLNKHGPKVSRADFAKEFSKALAATGLAKLPKAKRLKVAR